MLSVQTKQALHVLFHMGLHDPPLLTVSELSEEIDIPRHYLAHIVQRLAKMGYLETRKGPNGGVKLGKDPERIFVRAVLDDLGELDHDFPEDPCCLPEDLTACFVGMVLGELEEALEDRSLQYYLNKCSPMGADTPASSPPRAD